MSNYPKAFPVTFSDGTTRYFLNGKAALRYSQQHRVSVVRVGTHEDAIRNLAGKNAAAVAS